jgi:hypothetical protein
LANICTWYLFLSEFESTCAEFVKQLSPCFPIQFRPDISPSIQQQKTHQITNDVRKDLCWKHPFMQYASAYWCYHVRNGMPTLTPSLVEATRALSNTLSLRFWTLFFVYSQRWSREITKESTALAYLGMAHIDRLEENGKLLPPDHYPLVNPYYSSMSDNPHTNEETGTAEARSTRKPSFYSGQLLFDIAIRDCPFQVELCRPLFWTVSNSHVAVVSSCDGREIERMKQLDLCYRTRILS